MSNYRQKDEALTWQEIRTEHIVQDEWIDFRASAYRYPDGRIFEPFYSYSRRDYVVIVASDEEGRYLCVRQFRHGIKEVTTEFPAGGLERAAETPSDGTAGEAVWREYGTGKDHIPGEDPLEAAKRELAEETGYVSDEWRFLMKIPSNATIADNYAYFYEAKNCRKVTAQHLDETELLNVEKHTAQEIEEMIAAERFPQMSHVLAWMLVKK